MADRYSYLPSIGLYVIAGWTAAQLVAGFRWRQVTAALAAGIVITSMVVLTRIQTGCWRDSITLFSHALDVTGGNFPMEKEYAKELCAIGLFDDAIEHFDRAIAIHPRDYEALSYKARVLLQRRKTDEAVDLLERAIGIKPDHAEAHYYMGLARRVQGDRAGAIASFSEALRHRLGYTEAAGDLEEALLDEGKALLSAGKLDEAIERYERVLAFNARSAAAHNDLGAAYGRQGRVDRAIGSFEKALEMNPDFADAHCNLAMALYSAGRYDEAIGHVEQALRLQPDMERARKLRAVLVGK
jgi:tetratricopeptide (TPR) repeat protein